MIQAEPKEACGHVENGKKFWGKIVIVHRGECMFVGKFIRLISEYIGGLFNFDTR